MKSDNVSKLIISQIILSGGKEFSISSIAERNMCDPDKLLAKIIKNSPNGISLFKDGDYIFAINEEYLQYCRNCNSLLYEADYVLDQQCNNCDEDCFMCNSLGTKQCSTVKCFNCSDQFNPHNASQLIFHSSYECVLHKDELESFIRDKDYTLLN